MIDVETAEVSGRLITVDESAVDGEEHEPGFERVEKFETRRDRLKILAARWRGKGRNHGPTSFPFRNIGQLNIACRGAFHRAKNQVPI